MTQPRGRLPIGTATPPVAPFGVARADRYQPHRAARDRGDDVSSAPASGRFGRRRRSTLQRLERPRRVHRLLAVATDYVVEKLVDAVRSLALSAAPVQQRLGNAWIGALVHLRPDDFDDPRERALFTSIRDAVTAWGDIETATDSMSDGQALAAAGDLVELLGTICLTLAVEREHPAKTE